MLGSRDRVEEMHYAMDNTCKSGYPFVAFV